MVSAAAFKLVTSGNSVRLHNVPQDNVIGAPLFLGLSNLGSSIPTIPKMCIGKRAD